VDEQAWLSARFEANRARLRAVAHRMLGSPEEADDAVEDHGNYCAGLASAELRAWRDG
jgi:hypothetical protein